MACISRGRNTKQEVLVLGSRGCISYGGGLGIGHWGATDGVLRAVTGCGCDCMR